MKQQRKAFTLIELLIVLAIIAILLVVITPRLMGYVHEAKVTAAKNNAATVLSAAQLYVTRQESSGKDIPTTLDKTILSSYVTNLKAGDTISLTTSYQDSTHSYEIRGTYQTGDIIIDIPDMTEHKNE